MKWLNDMKSIENIFSTVFDSVEGPHTATCRRYFINVKKQKEK